MIEEIVSSTNTHNFVIVKDNHTIVISGLVRDDRTETEDKIPILGDIPLIGNLFRTTSNKTTKLNLLVFITPRVVKTTQQIADLTNLKRHQMEHIDRMLIEREEEAAAREYVLQEEETALMNELTSTRDLSWRAYQALAQKETEVRNNLQTSSSVNLASPAVPPIEPTSRGVLRNTAIAGALGFFLSVR